MKYPDGTIEAEYADGFIANELMSYTNNLITMNVAILSRINDKKHGPMLKFSTYIANEKITIDMSKLPRDAQPYRSRNFGTGLNLSPYSKQNSQTLNSIKFGFEYTDPKTKIKIQEIKEYKI